MKYKGLVYRKIIRKNSYEAFTCQICNRDFMHDIFYRSINLCYICKECWDKAKRELLKYKSKVWKYKSIEVKEGSNKLMKDCKECEALNAYVYNNFGVYYCWDKECRFIFEGDENLPIPTPKWCPRKGGNKVVKRKCEDTQDIKSEWR